MMAATPSVYIIVLAWNDYTFTAACLKSLRHITYLNATVVVVDNGSLAKYPDKLAHSFPEIPLIRNSRNLGFSGGNNVGIRYALSQGADYTLLLNNDTIVSDGFLEPLINYMEADPSVGMTSPKIYFQTLPNQIWAAGVNINLGQRRLVRLRRNRGLPSLLFELRGHHEIDTGQFDRAEKVDGAPGCACVISREALAQVGLLDEDYFLVHEDSDWSYRTRQAGFEIGIVPQSVIWHRVTASSGSAYSPSVVYYAHRNAFLFVSRHASSLAKIWFYLIGFGVCLRDHARLLLGNSDSSLIRVKIRAFVDFWRGHVGEWKP